MRVGACMPTSWMENIKPASSLIVKPRCGGQGNALLIWLASAVMRWRLRTKQSDMDKYPLFSNGTEFMWWQDRNCCNCVKAVWYNEKKDIFPKYRCMVQKHIEEAAITDGTGNLRDSNATHSRDCPYKCTERKRYTKKVKKDKRQQVLF